MGNTVRSFSNLGTREPETELHPDQEGLGDALEELSDEERLGDFLSKMSSDDGVDAVDAVRDVREDI